MYNALNRHPKTTVSKEDWYEETDADIERDLSVEYVTWTSGLLQEASVQGELERVKFYKGLFAVVRKDAIDASEEHEKLTIDIAEEACHQQYRAELKAAIKNRSAVGHSWCWDFEKRVCVISKRPTQDTSDDPASGGELTALSQGVAPSSIEEQGQATIGSPLSSKSNDSSNPGIANQMANTGSIMVSHSSTNNNPRPLIADLSAVTDACVPIPNNKAAASSHQVNNTNAYSRDGWDMEPTSPSADLSSHLLPQDGLLEVAAHQHTSTAEQTPTESYEEWRTW